MSKTMTPFWMSGLPGRGGRRTPTIQVIGPVDGECRPLRLTALRSRRIVELHQPEVVVGRHSEADLQLLEPDVSRFHCRFLWIEEQWELEDLGSLNGTQVNGQPVQRVVLAQSDVVRVADFLFQVDLGDPEQMGLVGAKEQQRSRQVLQSILAMLPEERVARRQSA